MAWEWVAPVATATSGIVGVAFTWYAGHQGRQHAEQVSRQAADLQLALAVRARRGEVYADALKMVSRIAVMLPAEPDAGSNPYMRPYDSEEYAEQLISNNALLGLYGSKDVQDRFDEFHRKLDAYSDALQRLRETCVNDTGAMDSARSNRDRCSEELDNSRMRLAEQMNKELTS
ncbi:hypothetical protein ACU635_53355 [[Actinomadura] parvosata]|uniref:hypothetical protein n=1 Tax=[Actinomadura] parvosata TaxID=1955412 RepID=UPI00406C02E4